MKHRLLIFGLILFVNGCAQNDYQVEDFLYNCLNDKFESENINLKSEILDFEKYLIDNKYLKDNSGQDYVDFFTQIKKLNDIPAEIEPDRFERLSKIPMSEYYSASCIDKLTQFDSTVIRNSKYMELQIALKNQDYSNGFEPSIIAKGILESLTPKDFEHQYYKTISLLMIVFTSNIDSGIERQLPPLSDTEKVESTISKDKTIRVFVKPDDTILLDNELIKLTDIKGKITEFIENNHPEHLIYLNADLGTSYGLYIKVQSEITSAYTDLRDKMSHKQYNKEYSELTETQMNEIKKIYPIRLTEAEYE